jgi:hypothetical protein
MVVARVHVRIFDRLDDVRRRAMQESPEPHG